MKKIVILIWLVLFGHLAFSQSCLPEGIEFWYQEQIDSFSVDYPGCTEIEGNVYIYGDDIKNLMGLSMITSVGGYLGFSVCDSLVNLEGLEGLTSVGEDFGFIDCDAITNLQVFIGLTSIGGDLRIISNDNLLSLDGLENIDANSINDLWIEGNSSLSLCELQNICNYLSSPNGTVNIKNNGPGCDSPPELAETCGISLPCLPFGNYYFTNQSQIDNFQFDYPECTDLAGYVRINGDDITNLAGLDGIQSIEYSLEIYYCDSLESLDGLENLDAIGYQLDINHCVSLQDLSGLQNLVSLNSAYIQANNNLASMDGFDGLTTLDGWLYIVSCNALESLSGLENLTNIGGDLGIGNDSSLSSLAGLGSLVTVGGELKIAGNAALNNLSGLDNLTAIGGHLTIQDNTNLSSLTGIDNIEEGSIDNLWIYDNTSLSQCAVQSVCEYLASPNGEVYISNNTGGCDSPDEVLEACAVGVDRSAVGSQRSAVSLYPNPAKGIVDFRLSIFDGRFGRVMFKIYDVQGREMVSLLDERRLPGEYTVPFDVSSLSPGIYFYRLTAEDQTTGGKLIIMR